MRNFLGREVLENFLLSEAVPRDGMGLYELTGFLTGLAAGPATIPVDEWLPLVWGNGPARFRDAQHGLLIQDLIIRHHAEISRTLSGPCDHSGLLAIEDLEERIIMAYAWSDGFLQAVELRPAAWLPLISEPEACKLLLPLLTLYREAVDDVELPLSEDLRRAVLSAAAEQIPNCGYRIRRFWDGLAGRAATPRSRVAAGRADRALAMPFLQHRNNAAGAYERNGGANALIDNVLPLLKPDRSHAPVMTGAADEAVMITNMSGVILSVNTTFTDITGFSAQEALGKTPRIMKSHLTQSPDHLSFWRELTATGHWHGSIWNRSRDGTLFQIRQTVSTVKNARDESVGYLSVFQEIDRRRAC